MPITLWIITNMDGELEGPFASINASSQVGSFEDYVPPAGYKKTLLSHADYEKISSSFNIERKIYEKHFNQATAKVREMPAARKTINEARAKRKYRERRNAEGKLVKYFYNADGTLDRTEVEE